MRNFKRYGLYETASVWPAERHAPATDGFVHIAEVELDSSDLAGIAELFEAHHRVFVEQLRRPHKLALHLGVSFHQLSEREHLVSMIEGYTPASYGGTQGILPPTCLLQEWAIEEVRKGVEGSFALVRGLDDFKRATQHESALLRISIHVFPEELEGELAAYVPVPVEEDEPENSDVLDVVS